ncbi:cytochrome P450 [Halomarina salina]|uniref:Cytochrome P450 n=1 Tax=Halomarina salina TaxID=1872699 RepID=A0ABD5RP05_9EURY|nr:cytochrome P450 [Halomarina salina]
MSRGDPPEPDGLPVLGNTLQYLRDPGGFYETCAEYGDVVRAQVGRDERYVVSHPDLVEQVLVSEDATYRTPDLLSERTVGLFGDGPRTAGVDRWRRLQNVVETTFTADRVAAYADTTVRHAETMAALWDDGETVPVDEAMRELTLDVLVDALFGADADHQQRRSELENGGDRGERVSERLGDSERIREAVHAFDEALEALSATPLVPNWVPTRTNRRYRQALSAFDDVVADLVARRHEERVEDRHDVLSVLLHTDDSDVDLDESAIRDQLVRLLVAGHETTAAALTFTAYALATHPGVADRLQAEVDAVLGTESATAADLPDLGYTERVVRESLRRYPPQYATVRRAAEETELAGYRVPPDATVVLPQWVVHNDPRWFTAPKTFRPERWATWDGPAFAYFPFGGGTRDYVGQRFAMQELTLVVATMAQQVSFEPASGDPLALAFGTTLRPRDGLDLVVRERVATPRN